MAYSIDGFPGRTIEIKGRPYLYFGGTAYLGVQTDADFQEMLFRNIKKYGTNYGASRNSNVQLAIYEEAEAHLAKWAGSEACLTMSSGYLAGQLVCNSFPEKEYKLFYAPNSHSALQLVQGGKARTKPHVTYSALNFAIRELLRSEPGTSPVVLLDSIDFSGYNYPDFEGLVSLPLDEVILIADDSHGIGVVGPSGSGAYSRLLELRPKELIVCCSLGKALGVQAGAIMGTKDRISTLKDTHFFEGASPAAPSYLATLVQASGLYAEKQKLLQSRIGSLLARLESLEDFRIVEEHPALAYSDVELTRQFADNGIIVTDFSYLSDSDQLTSRIVLNAAHTEEDIHYLLSILNSDRLGRDIEN